MLRLPSVHLFSSSYNTFRFIMIHTKVLSGVNGRRPRRPRTADPKTVLSTPCLFTQLHDNFKIHLIPLWLIFNKKSFLILDRKWILSYERHYKSLFYIVFIYLFVNLVIGISFSWRFLEKFISRAPSSDCCGVIVDTLGMFEIMTRVILIPYDLVTPFDLEGQTFMVNVELSTF